MSELSGFQHVDLDLLKAFWLLAHADSVSAAIANRGVTRFTLSRKIAALEEQLGFPLFESGKKVQLTTAGYELLRVLEKYLPDLAVALGNLRSDQAPRIVIGGSACFAQSHWPLLFSRLSAAERPVKVEVITDSEERLLASWSAASCSSRCCRSIIRCRGIFCAAGS